MRAGARVRRRKFWGWGYEGEGLTPEELELLARSLAGRLGVPESQIDEEGIQTFLTEVRDLGSDRGHDHGAR